MHAARAAICFGLTLIAVFGLEFPTVQKPFYAPIVERIEDSFGFD